MTTKPHDWSPELACAIEAAHAGGAAALSFYGTKEATLKEGGSPVTAADHASSHAIIDHITTRFPDDAILCEETSDTAARLSARRLWVIDPLDGTKEFLAQNGEFSVMIALVADGEPVVGVVFLPATDRLYFAAQGEGAWLQEGEDTTRLHASQPGDGLRIVTSRSHADATVDALCAALPVAERRPSGSVGIKCALIAQGDCDVYAHPVPYMGEWDTCAPEVLLREAGGTVTDCHGRPLRYNKPDPHQPDGILACAPGLLERVLPIVRDVIAAGA